MSAGPVFIAGLADSGKTPLGRMLTHRTDIVITRHTQLWNRFAGSCGDLRDARNLERLLLALLRDPAVARLQPDPVRLRASLSGREPTPSAVFAQLHSQHAERLGKRRWGEQCGSLETYAPQLLRDLPTARVVHLVRDPAASYGIAVRRSGDGPGRLGRYTARWVASAELARRNVQRFPDRYLVVRYESLVARTDETMRGVCGFLDEPVGREPFVFGEGSSHHGNGTAEGGGKYAVEVAATGAGRRDGDVRFLATHAAGQLHALGYGRPVVRSGPRPGELARWPANRVALAITRRPTPMAWPSRQGG